MLRLIPLLVFVSILSFMVRIGDVVIGVKTPQQMMNASVSAASSDEKNKEKEPVNVPAGLSEAEPAPLPQDDWADPTTLDIQFSATQSVVIKELKQRRDELDNREGKINQREALLQVTEKRIEEKIAELSELRMRIEDLLGKQSEEEEKRLQSLVKIYSGMKPKDAASIFDKLDIDILLQVVSRMSERKSAPIMAAMDTQRAQKLTTMLAEQIKLPDLP